MRFLLTIVLAFISAVSFATRIVGEGTVTQVVNGSDTLLVFRNEIHLKADTMVDWYLTDGTLVASNTDEIYPDEGGYYVVKANGAQSSPKYAFLYTEPTITSLTVTPDCDVTTIELQGDPMPFRYTRPDNTPVSFARACTIHYNALAWNTEQWVDSAAQMETVLYAGYYTLPPLYGPTPISFCYDAEIRSKLGMDSACVTTTLALEDVHAVKMNVTSLVTTRGEEGDKSNERNRPTSQTLISTSSYSGPLEVAFYSNPTPAAQFYRWTIYKSTEHIATRNDMDIRYVFNEPGAYTVVCAVNNAHCTSDSAEVIVTVAESYLWAPNVFTPNGDGKNDEFRVTYRSLREFHGWIYNRWGKLVFEWTDPAKGWDGTINGRPAAAGAYYYVIRALGTDAGKDAKYMMKATYKRSQLNHPESVMGIWQLSGDINLLR